MKRIIISSLVAMSILISGTACSSGANPSSSSSLPSLPDVSSLVNAENTENYEMYNYGESSYYNGFVLENPVDKSYHKNYPDTGITSEMMKYEAEFADIWKIEMEFSIQNLTDSLNNEGKAKLASLQNDWVEWTSQNLSFEHNLLSSKEYGVELGSLFLVSQRNAYRTAYRTRTFQIKYIHFLLETQGNTPKSTSDCESLKFLFKE